MVNRYMATPQKPHMEVVKKIFRYFHGTIDFGSSTGEVKLEGFIDANWTGDIDTRRSTTRYVF